jgi:hypothetical protein
VSPPGTCREYARFVGGVPPHTLEKAEALNSNPELVIPQSCLFPRLLFPSGFKSDTVRAPCRRHGRTVSLLKGPFILIYNRSCPAVDVSVL